MLQLEESGIQFEFDQQWLLRRYDVHNFYQGLSGAGLKGVDFIGILHYEHLYLIEIKNYRSHGHPKRRKAVLEALRAQDRLQQQLVQKVEDTLTAVRAISTYYQRKFSYRLLLPLLRKGYYPAGNWRFWSLAYELYLSLDRVTFVLCMEVDPEFVELRQHIWTSLHQRLDSVVGEVIVTGSEGLAILPGLQAKLPSAL